VKKSSKIERYLLIGATLLLLPMLSYTLFLTRISFIEGDIYRNAPILNPEGGQKIAPEYGVFYQARGKITGPLLNPTEHPEVKDGLQTIITRETLNSETQKWKMVGKKPDWIRANDFSIGDQPIKVAVASRIMVETKKETVQRTETERFIIEQQAAQPVDYVVFGMFVSGFLQDGHHERLVIAPLSEIENVLAYIADSGRKKAVVMAILSGIIIVLIGLTIKAAFSNKPRVVPR
jgi:hypothetical protein